MTKAIFATAAVLALSTTSAWAGEAKTETNTEAKSGEVVVARQARTPVASKSRSDVPRVPQADTGAAKAESSGVRAFDAQRWLVEREGYRDGGY